MSTSMGVPSRKKPSPRATFAAVATVLTTLWTAGTAEALLVQYYAGGPGSDEWQNSSYTSGIKGGRTDMSAYVLVKIRSQKNTGSVYQEAVAPQSVNMSHGALSSSYRSRCQWYVGSPGSSPGNNVMSCSYRL